MEELTLELKRCLFGGYERESVLVYIRELMGRLERAQTELDKAQALQDTLSGQNQQLFGQLSDQNKNMERLLEQLSEQKAELDGFHARESRLEEQEAEAQAMLEGARRQAEVVLENARAEQTRLTEEALRARRKAVAEAEQRVKELRTLAEGLWAILNGARNADREVG